MYVSEAHIVRMTGAPTIIFCTLRLEPSIRSIYNSRHSTQELFVLAHYSTLSVEGIHHHKANFKTKKSRRECLCCTVNSHKGYLTVVEPVAGVWLSADHQMIVWCNQLVVRVSQALLRTSQEEDASLPLLSAAYFQWRSQVLADHFSVPRIPAYISGGAYKTNLALDN